MKRALTSWMKRTGWMALWHKRWLCRRQRRGCGRTESRPARALAYCEHAPSTLEGWNLFEDTKTQTPGARTLPYDVIAPLFADYALKQRLSCTSPRARPSAADPEGLWQLPEGSVLDQNLQATPADQRDPTSPKRLTRERACWVFTGAGVEPHTYVWDEAQQHNALKVAGATLKVSWIHFDGAQRTDDYRVPNTNDCFECHGKREVANTLGLRTRQPRSRFRLRRRCGQPARPPAAAAAVRSAARSRTRGSRTLGRPVRRRPAERPRAFVLGFELRAVPQTRRRCIGQRHVARMEAHRARSATDPVGRVQAPQQRVRRDLRQSSRHLAGRPARPRSTWCRVSRAPNRGSRCRRSGRSLVHEEGVELSARVDRGLRPQLRVARSLRRARCTARSESRGWP